MSSLTKRWNIREQIPIAIEQALGDFHPILKQLLYNRGIYTYEEAYRFLQAEAPANTDPLSMHGVPAAVERILYAIEHKEPIAIYGDYDVDGVTATALLVQFLSNLGAEIQGYIPHRFDEGYGLNLEALTTLKEKGVKLVVTVDCGIRSPVEAEFASKIGLDLIISDHHHPGPDLPQALSVINPKQALDSYPDKDLAGVGLAYKLAAGLVETLQKQRDSIPEHFHPKTFIDLVALGTVADLAPLLGENRSLVRQGLIAMRNPRRQGLQSLIGVAGLTARKLNTWDIGFLLGPRLNAAGRLESAMTALKLLLSQDVQESGELAQKLDDQNRRRQEQTLLMQVRAEEILKPEVEQALLLFASDPSFNAGLVGLVASRLTEQYYRPAVVVQTGEEYARGSCRSIPEFHITAALDQCADLMEHHGGHAAAAGFTVKNEYLPELEERLKHIAASQLSALDLQPHLDIDIELPLHELKPDILGYLDWLQPTGQGNPQALFVSRGLKVPRFRGVGKENAHLKMTVTDGEIYYDAIAFRQGAWLDHMPDTIDLVYTFEVNEFNGRETLQLNVRDLKPSAR